MSARSDIMTNIPRGPDRTAKLGELSEQFPASVVGGADDNNGTIPFDMKFPLNTPIDKPRELWFDHAIVQETCPTYASGKLKFLDEKKRISLRTPLHSKDNWHKTMPLFGTD